MSSARSTSCRPANDAFVATTRVGVGPGVKIEDMRFVRKAAIPAADRSTIEGGVKETKGERGGNSRTRREYKDEVIIEIRKFLVVFLERLEK